MPDVFEDPQAFVRAIIEPIMQQRDQRDQQIREAESMEKTARRFGPEMVTQSREALRHFIQAGDPVAYGTWQHAMKSHDPYGVIADWYYERSLLHEIGGDLNAYKQKVLEQATKDPNFQKRLLEATRNQAQANGAFVNRSAPVNAPVPTMPSLGNIGAGGGDNPLQEPSDMEYFRAATSAKRR
jgi:hypothetical protein